VASQWRARGIIKTPRPASSIAAAARNCRKIPVTCDRVFTNMLLVLRCGCASPPRARPPPPPPRRHQASGLAEKACWPSWARCDSQSCCRLSALPPSLPQTQAPPSPSARRLCSSFTSFTCSMPGYSPLAINNHNSFNCSMPATRRRWFGAPAIVHWSIRCPDLLGTSSTRALTD
jgi:hypothetical protein